MKAIRLALPALLLTMAAGCAENHPAAPAASPDDAWLSRNATDRSLNFVHRAPGTAPFHRQTATLEVRPGEAASATLYFLDGSPFAQLSLPLDALHGAHINGRPVGPEETVEITLRRADASRYLVELQPAGLEFNPQAPANLVFFYDNAVVPADGQVGVSKQDRRGQAWQATEHEDNRGTRQLRARVRDFTIYAMAHL
jgi:hypothetical protein